MTARKPRSVAMTARKPVLRECPFCGSLDVGAFTCYLADARLKAVGCKCGAEGPAYRRTADAIEAWNERHASAVSKPPVTK